MPQSRVSILIPCDIAPIFQNRYCDDLDDAPCANNWEIPLPAH